MADGHFNSKTVNVTEETRVAISIKAKTDKVKLELWKRNKKKQN